MYLMKSIIFSAEKQPITQDKNDFEMNNYYYFYIYGGEFAPSLLTPIVISQQISQQKSRNVVQFYWLYNTPL